jgi:hypothetical protein
VGLPTCAAGAEEAEEEEGDLVVVIIAPRPTTDTEEELMAEPQQLLLLTTRMVHEDFPLQISIENEERCFLYLPQRPFRGGMVDVQYRDHRSNRIVSEGWFELIFGEKFFYYDELHQRVMMKFPVSSDERQQKFAIPYINLVYRVSSGKPSTAEEEALALAPLQLLPSEAPGGGGVVCVDAAGACCGCRRRRRDGAYPRRCHTRERGRRAGIIVDNDV